MVFAIEGILALLVLSGSGMIVWGARRFKLSSQILAITFAITAVSWIAFLITTISIAVRTFFVQSA
jgi:hypothetical protein